jgi:hypothetical protein
VSSVVQHCSDSAQAMAVLAQAADLVELGLLVPESFDIGSPPSYWCKAKSMCVQSKILPEKLKMQSRDLALDAALKIYREFGWLAEKAQLAKEQKSL